MLFISIAFGQDILITISGKAYKGEYVKIEGDKVLFIQQGAKKPVNIPKQSVRQITLENGNRVGSFLPLIGKVFKVLGKEIILSDDNRFEWKAGTNDFFNNLDSVKINYLKRNYVIRYGPLFNYALNNHVLSS